MWHLDADPSLRFHVVGVVGLASQPESAELLRRMERMTRVVPRLRHRVVPNSLPGLRPHWELDPLFDLAYHVRWVALPEGGGDADVLHLASLTRQDDFPPERPPWRMLVVPGLPEGRAALIMVMHHVITDGVGAVRMAAELFDLDPQGRGTVELPPAPVAAHRTSIRRLVNGLTQEADQVAAVRGILRSASQAVRQPRHSAHSLADAAAAVAQLADPNAGPGSALPRIRSAAGTFLTVQVPVDGLRAAAAASGGKLNDAYLAVLVGGLRRYHDMRGLPLEQATITMPVNMRQSGSTDTGGNAVLLKIVQLPADIADPRERIGAFRELALREQSDGAHTVSHAVENALGRLPGTLLRTAVGSLADTIDIATTNVPGVPLPLYLAGARVTSMRAFLPRGRSPLSAALLSYNGTAYIGLTVDPVAIPDTDVLVSCIESELEAVLGVAAQGDAEPLLAASA